MASRRFRARASIGTVITGAERRIAYLEKNPAPRRIRGQAITTDLLYRNAVITEAIAPLAVTNGEVADSAVSNRTIATDAIDARVISADAITAGKISADAITAREIKANAITASEISANAITAGKISADAITAREIQANAITASEISANAVVAGKISANAVTATTIAAGSISAEKIVVGGITANVLSSGTINASVISVTNLNASNITAGTLTGRTVRTGSGGNRVELANSNQLLFFVGGGQVASMIPIGSGLTGARVSSSGATLSVGQFGVTMGSGSYYINSNNTGNLINGGLSVQSGNLSCGMQLTAYGITNLGSGTIRINSFAGTGTRNVSVAGNGNLLVGGTSDSRLKKNVKISGLGLSFVNELRPVSFEWKEKSNPGTQYGLIAQEVETALKAAGAVEDSSIVFRHEAVPKSLASAEDESPVRHIDYIQLIPTLIKAVQELTARVEELESKDK